MIAKDKLLHAAAGIIMALVCTPLLGWWAIAPVVIAGVGKELYDATGKGTPDIYDAVWTIAAGSLVVAIIMELTH